MNTSSSVNLTLYEIEVLANEVHEIRPDWGIPGIARALHKLARQHLGRDLQVAAKAAARNPAIKTPTGIGFAGPHWPAPARYRPGLVARCQVCGKTAARCEFDRPPVRRLEDVDDHAFEPAPERPAFR